MLLSNRLLHLSFKIVKFLFHGPFFKAIECENGKTGSSCRNLLRNRTQIHNQIPNEMKMKMNFYMLCTHAAREREGDTETR